MLIPKQIVLEVNADKTKYIFMYLHQNVGKVMIQIWLINI